MSPTCHLCENEVAVNGDVPEGAREGFECADCGGLTCPECKSIGVGQDSDHCRRCRG